REPPLPVAARGHAALHGLADGPVLSVHKVPEVGRIRAVAVRLLWCDEHVEDDAGTGCAGWMEDERRNVIGGKAEEQVGIDELSLVPHPLGRVEPGERRTMGRPGCGEGPGTGPVGDARIPIQVATSVA